MSSSPASRTRVAPGSPTSASAVMSTPSGGPSHTSDSSRATRSAPEPRSASVTPQPSSPAADTCGGSGAAWATSKGSRRSRASPIAQESAQRAPAESSTPTTTRGPPSGLTITVPPEACGVRWFTIQ
ncbi:hypothetical protein BJF79_20135 [Actinomadura sp. CNU-125]|nr:hypothetical protein BJF79_20135 [Actinomadura sp. CNU-125]